MRRPLLPLLLCVTVWIAATGCRPRHDGGAPNPGRADFIHRPASEVDDHDIRQTVEYLASETLQGRGVGTQGLDAAAEYIAARFERAGLRPAPGMNGYQQLFEVRISDEIDPGTRLRVGEEVFVQGLHFTPLSFSKEGEFKSKAAFAGYGVASETHGYDDYARLDVKGKIVLAMRFEPHDADGKSRFATDEWSLAASILKKAELAADHGAAALLLVNPPMHHDNEGLMPFGRQFAGLRAKIPVMQVTERVANRLLEPTGAELKALQNKIDQSGEPSSMPLGDVDVAGEVIVHQVREPVKNIVAMLPGTGERRGEYVVIGAHYDHVGMGGGGTFRPNIRAIHPGADDNASGTAALIELAKRFATEGPRDRSILFVAFTAEESGLLGSRYFVEHSPVPLEKIVAMVNMDMVGRVRDETIHVGGAGTAAAFDEVLRAAEQASVLSTRGMGRGGIGPSDHASFALKQIPVLFFFSGLHGDYHRPTDTADKINYEGIEQITDLVHDIVSRIIELPRQQYVDAGGAHGMMVPGATTRAAPGGSRVILGIMPDYAIEDIKGVRVGGVSADTPADKAGLVAGDIIIQFGKDKIESLYDLAAVLASARPGQTVKLVILRGEQRIETETTLAARE